MQPRCGWVAVTLAALLATQPACSFMFLDEPPAHPTPSCEDSRVKPAADVALGTMWLLPAMIATIFGVDHTTCINDDCEEVEGDGDAAVLAVGFWATTVAHYVSAGVGFKRAGRCRDRKQAYFQGMPPPMAPPPMAPPGPPGSY